MNDEELLRYSRHLLLPEIDVEGQQRLLRSRVLVVGLGGLGSPAALYLAACGVGELVIADADLVELSNLQRQLLHETPDVGKAKTASAAARIARLNPGVRVTQVQARLDADSLASLMGGLSLALDCSDNFATRYALNSACMQHGVPLLSAAALGWEGQLAFFDPQDACSPCYRCIFPVEDASEERSCAREGVAAPVVGAIGVLQALQALKFLTGAGDVMRAELLLFDALAFEWHRLRVERDPACPVCGDR